MFKIISGSLLTVITSAVVLVGIANAQDVRNLKEVVVTATTSDNVQVFIPADYTEATRLQRDYASISDTLYVTDMSRFQVCQVLRQHPPQNCTTSNYPAAPGIPSASGAEWGGNGCGTGPFATAFASAALVASPLNYSYDLNKPVKGNPSIDFTNFCSGHDLLYTSGVTKSFADKRFETQLKGLCAAAPSDRDACSTFALVYVVTVKMIGGSAYEADQKQLACAEWGDSMKKSGCS